MLHVVCPHMRDRMLHAARGETRPTCTTREYCTRPVWKLQRPGAGTGLHCPVAAFLHHCGLATSKIVAVFWSSISARTSALRPCHPVAPRAVEEG